MVKGVDCISDARDVKIMPQAHDAAIHRPSVYAAGTVDMEK